MRSEMYVLAAMLASLVIGIETVYVMAGERRTRTFGVITVSGVVAFPVAVVLHNVVSALLGMDEAASFILGAVLAPAATTFGTLGIALVLRRTMPLAAAGFTLFGIGMALFPVYVVAVLLLTALSPGAVPRDQLEAVMLPASLAAIVAGDLVNAFALAAADDARRVAMS